MTDSPLQLRTQLFRYLIVGGLAIAIDAITYYALTTNSLVEIAWAKRISFAMGAVWGFFVNKFFTFGKRTLSVQEPLLFTLVYICGWFLNSIIHDSVLRLGSSKPFAFLLATCASTCTNFVGQKWLVFRQNHRPSSLSHGEPPDHESTRPATTAITSRDPGLDALRGFLILCVVVGHMPLGNFLGWQPEWWSWLNETLYLFHVPLFLALGCLFAPGLQWRPLTRSLLAILIPYVLWFAWQQHQVLSQQPTIWLQWLARGNFAALQSILWFLPALISARMFSSLLQLCVTRPGGLIAVAGLWLVSFAYLDWLVAQHASIPFGLDVVLMCLPYFVLIFIVERQRSNLEWIPPYAWLCLAIGLGCWMYINEPLKTHTPWHKRIDLAQLSLPHTLGAYLIWSALGVSWWMTFRRISWYPLLLLGRHSLPIYLIHYEVFKWFLIRPQQLPSGPGIFATILVLGLSILGPLSLSLLARRVWRDARWLGL